MATRKSKTSDFQKLFQRELQDPEVRKGYEAEKKRTETSRRRTSKSSDASPKKKAA